METSTPYSQGTIDIFRNPARIIIAGYSNSRNSEMCSKIIQKYHHKFNTVLYCGVNSHNLQNNLVINPFASIGRKLRFGSRSRLRSMV